MWVLNTNWIAFALLRVALVLPSAGLSGSSALRLYPLAPSTDFAAEFYAFLLDLPERWDDPKPLKIYNNYVNVRSIALVNLGIC